MPAILSTSNSDKIVENKGLIEAGKYQVGDIFQLERMGFARITEISENSEIKLVFLHE